MSRSADNLVLLAGAAAAGSDEGAYITGCEIRIRGVVHA